MSTIFQKPPATFLENSCLMHGKICECLVNSDYYKVINAYNFSGKSYMNSSEPPTYTHMHTLSYYTHCKHVYTHTIHKHVTNLLYMLIFSISESVTKTTNTGSIRNQEVIKK